MQFDKNCGSNGWDRECLLSVVAGLVHGPHGTLSQSGPIPMYSAVWLGGVSDKRVHIL